MAHEIKNPLTPIQLSAERLSRGLHRDESAASEKYRALVEECTATIMREVGALQHMVVEFSRYARMPRPRFELEDLNAIAKTAVALYEGRLDGATLDLRCDDSMPQLTIDREQVQRVIVNLVDNALEATSGCTERRVTVTTEFDPASEVARLSVADTGHGVPPNLKERLFLPYFSTSSRGSGLGLAIVSHIVGDHRGRVWCEPNQPSGARFVVEFPVVAERGEPVASADDQSIDVRVAT
jgi:nitrogen fixation/metabolism regulation signal transduction histidine kinase